MITLSKSGNAVKFTFDENDHYLQNGTIEVPVNSLALIIDDSDMVTFRKSASNDIFVSANYSEFGMSKAELEAWYKTYMVGSSGGGTGGTTPEEVQEMIDTSLAPYSTTSEVDSMIDESISGKADTSAVDALNNTVTAHTADTTIHVTANDKAAWNNKSDFSGDYNDLTNKPTIPTVPTSNTAFTNDAGYITSSALDGYATEDYVTASTSTKLDVSTFETYSGNVETELDGKQPIGDYVTSSQMSAFTYDKQTIDEKIAEGGIFDPTQYYTTAQTYSKTETNSLLDEKLDATAYTPTDLSNYDTKSEVNTKIEQATSGKVDTSTFNAYSGNVETELSGKQDTLSAGTNITIVDNVISAEGGSSYTAGDGIDITNDVISVTGKVDTSTYSTYTAATDTALASKADTATTYTKTEVDNAITAATSTKQDTLVSGTNIKTINNESILGSGNIDIQGGGGGGKAIVAGRGIAITSGETADTVSFNLPISAGTGTNSLVVCGNGNAAIGASSVAVGTNNSAYSNNSMAVGSNNKAHDGNSFAIGYSSEAKNANSFAAGQYAETNGFVSMSLGRETITNNMAEFACGQDNVSNKASNTYGDSGNTLFSVGNGEYGGTRHNAFEIRQNGDIYLSSGGTDIKLQDHLGGGGSSYTAGNGIDITNDVISVTGKADTSAVTEVSDALTAHTANTTIHVTAADKTAWNSKSDFSGSYNDLTDKLSAGTNITIVDNVISATGGGGGGSTYTAGTGINITNDVISVKMSVGEPEGYPYYSPLNKNNSGTTTSERFLYNILGYGYQTLFDFNDVRNKQTSKVGYIFYDNTITSTVSGHTGYGVSIRIYEYNSTNQLYYSSAIIDWKNKEIFFYNKSSASFDTSIVKTIWDYYGKNSLLLYTEPLWDNEGMGGQYALDVSSTSGWDGLILNSFGRSDSKCGAYKFYQNAENYSLSKTVYNHAKLAENNLLKINDINAALGGLKLVKLSQSEYDSLATKDNSTLYVIVN